MAACHVVFLTENLPFERDRRVKREALALREAGYKVSVVCPKDSQNKASGSGVIDGLSVYRYRQPWQGTGVLNYFFEYGWAILCTFFLLFWIWGTDDVDILHAANPPDLFFLIAIPFLLMGKKFVFDQHDLCPELLRAKFGERKILNRILCWCETWSYRLANLIVVTNESARDIAITRGKISPSKIRIVRNAPDLSTFRVGSADLGLKKGYKHLALYVGAIGSQDGVDRIICAIDHIVHHRQCKDVLFALLGDGDYLFEAKRLAKLLQVEEYIEFRGWAGDAELLSYLSTADVCLAPDPPIEVNEKSTFIKVMEYMSCNKATVSFDLLETRRAAGLSAVYVSNDDAALFGDAILELLDNPVRREEMGREGFQRVRSGLHWGISRDTLLGAYAEISAGYGPRYREGAPIV
jgi:glycosyltransferase involved in cell wall biosynthesis